MLGFREIIAENFLRVLFVLLFFFRFYRNNILKKKLNKNTRCNIYCKAFFCYVLCFVFFFFFLTVTVGSRQAGWNPKHQTIYSCIFYQLPFSLVMPWGFPPGTWTKHHLFSIHSTCVQTTSTVVSQWRKETVCILALPYLESGKLLKCVSAVYKWKQEDLGLVPIEFGISFALLEESCHGLLAHTFATIWGEQTWIFLTEIIIVVNHRP